MMLSMHAVKTTEGEWTTSFCGRRGTKAADWNYLSASGKTRFQAIDPAAVSESTPDIRCPVCIKRIKAMGYSTQAEAS